MKSYDRMLRSLSEYSVWIDHNQPPKSFNFTPRSKSASRAFSHPPRGSTASVQGKKTSSVCHKNQSRTTNEIIGIEVDSIPFFYPANRGGSTSTSLLIVLSDGSLVRVHTTDPSIPSTPVSSILCWLSFGLDLFLPYRLPLGTVNGSGYLCHRSISCKYLFSIYFKKGVMIVGSPFGQ